MARLMCNDRPQDRISTVKLRHRMQLSAMRENLENKRLLWLGHIEILGGISCFGKYQAFRVGVSLVRGWLTVEKNLVKLIDVEE